MLSLTKHSGVQQICPWRPWQLARDPSGYGVLTDIVLRMVGAMVGDWIMRLLGFYTSGGLIVSILVAILGAVVVIYIVGPWKKSDSIRPGGLDLY